MSVRPGETDEERADRNLSELLQELRVALPGVQVLFAFLLTVAVSSGFPDLTAFQRDLYFAVLVATAVSTALLIAPSAHHRILFHLQDKTHLVKVSNRYAIAGLAILGVAIVGAVLLVADILFDGAKVPLFTVLVAVPFVLFWGVLPYARRGRVERLREAESGGASGSRRSGRE